MALFLCIGSVRCCLDISCFTFGWLVNFGFFVHLILLPISIALGLFMRWYSRVLSEGVLRGTGCWVSSVPIVCSPSLVAYYVCHVWLVCLVLYCFPPLVHPWDY